MAPRKEKQPIKIFEYETSFLIGAGLITYFSGFFIVNAYLSRFHLVDLETVNLGIFQPAYVTAGLMYLIISIISFTLSLPVAISIYEYMKNKFRSYISKRDWILPVLLRTLPIFLWDVLGVAFVSVMLSFAQRLHSNEFIEFVKGLFAPFFIVILLQSIFASLPIICLFLLRKKIKSQIRVNLVAFFALLFLFTHSYTLLITADRIYEQLPVIVGGGQPRIVKFSVTQENSKKLYSISKNLPKQIIEDPDLGSETDNNTDNATVNRNDVFQTNDLVLYWQFGSAGFAQNEIEAVYFIRPEGCDNCPIVQIPKSAVFGVIYIKTP